jgi:hypothetical protein
MASPGDEIRLVRYACVVDVTRCHTTATGCCSTLAGVPDLPVPP